MNTEERDDNENDKEDEEYQKGKALHHPSLQ